MKETFIQIPSCLEMEKEQVRAALRRADIIHALNDSNEKRIGVYMRVAAPDDAVCTLELLKQHYRNLLANNPNWVLYKFYIDEGVADSDAYLEMMEDARCHRIDLIITRSLSKFPGGFTIGITTAQELARLTPPVGVLFSF